MQPPASSNKAGIQAACWDLRVQPIPGPQISAAPGGRGEGQAGGVAALEQLDELDLGLLMVIALHTEAVSRARLIERAREEFGEKFWGFWMLGGMSGGGMGFIFAPEEKPRAQQRLQEIMSGAKKELQHALPFAMEPVVYDFAINAFFYTISSHILFK